jgi:hypothetical protein
MYSGLKGTVSRDFDLWFFRQTVLLGPLIHGLKGFAYRFEFEE